MEKYTMVETIPKKDGTKVYVINEKVDEIFGTPVVKQIFRGTLEECEKELKKKQYLQFVKKFSKITVTKICKDLNINRSNTLHGNSSEETTRMLYEELKKRVEELIKGEE